MAEGEFDHTFGSTDPKKQTVVKVNKVKLTNLFTEFLRSIANIAKSLIVVLPTPWKDQS